MMSVMEKLINGFNEKEIFQLYEFVNAYEEGGINNYKSIRKLLDKHTELSELSVILSEVTCHKSNAAEMKILDFKSFHNEIYFTKPKNSNILCLLYHLRNSIAHANAVKNKKDVLITDFEAYGGINFTARGKIELKIINRLTETLKKIVL